MWIYNEIKYHKNGVQKKYSEIKPLHDVRYRNEMLITGNDAIILTNNVKSNIFNLSNETSYYDDEPFFDDDVLFYAALGDIDEEAYVFISDFKLEIDLIDYFKKKTKLTIKYL